MMLLTFLIKKLVVCKDFWGAGDDFASFTKKADSFAVNPIVQKTTALK